MPMAGGPISYCYFTAETRKMEMAVDNCPDNDIITITAPEGFSHYEWKTGENVSIRNNTTYPWIAYVNRSEIQEHMDYKCIMSGDVEDCSKIEGIVQLAKDPLGAKFAKRIACDNEVKFVNESYITPVKQQTGEIIEPDEITKYTWRCTDGMGHNYELVTTKKDETPTYILEYTQENKGYYTVTLDIETKNGCTSHYEEEISISPRENISIDGEFKVCRGSEANLQISNYNDPGNVYTWYRVNGTSKTKVWEGTGYEYSKLNVKPNGKENYTVEILRIEDITSNNIVVDKRNCIYSKDFEVDVYEIPTISITGTGGKASSMTARPKYVDICESEDNATLTATETTNPKLGITSWTWSDLNNTNKDIVSPQDTTMYYVYAKTKEGCEGKDSIKVNVRKKPTLIIDGGDEICVGESITLKAKSAENDVTDATKYHWYEVDGSTEREMVKSATKGGSTTDS